MGKDKKKRGNIRGLALGVAYRGHEKSAETLREVGTKGRQ